MLLEKCSHSEDEEKKNYNLVRGRRKKIIKKKNSEEKSSLTWRLLPLRDGKKVTKVRSKKYKRIK